jgi:uncharacterized damage-inducible protein DinB
MLMSNDSGRQLTIDALEGYEPEIGRWLAALEDTRHLTKESLTDLSQAALDWRPPQGGNSIGTILYHLAAIELDWLFAEVLQEPEPWPATIMDHFVAAVRDDQGHLSTVQGASLVHHLDRLDLVRARLLTAFQEMPLQEFRRARSLPQYEVTPEWVLHHLIQHEAAHRGHVQMLRTWAEQALGGSLE